MKNTLKPCWQVLLVAGQYLGVHGCLCQIFRFRDSDQITYQWENINISLRELEKKGRPRNEIQDRRIVLPGDEISKISPGSPITQSHAG